MELDRVSEEFRKTHAERQDIVKQLEALLAVMRKRDRDIDFITEV